MIRIKFVTGSFTGSYNSTTSFNNDVIIVCVDDDDGALFSMYKKLIVQVQNVNIFDGCIFKKCFIGYLQFNDH